LPIPLQDFSDQQIHRHARKARKLALRHSELTPVERHKMRIAFKKLRYTLEFFSPLVSPKKLHPYLAALTHLQDQLGLINDHVTAETLIQNEIEKGQAGPLRGWISGRHALLVDGLAETLQTWLAQRLA
jgi:CHAD domain-containing protein